MENKDFLKIESLLFNENSLQGLSDLEKDEFQNYIYEHIDIEKHIFNVQYILAILNKAKLTNPHEYLRNVFLEWIYIQRNTKSNKSRILYNLTLANTISDPDEYKTHLVNIYRSIVSELLDPYLTLLYASIKFKEGTFTSVTEVNYEQAEINKFEYIKSRDKSEGFLQGYNSIVRNAVSHRNVDSITFEGGKIVFKDIKRGVEAKVKRVEWDLQTLKDNINDLLQFTLSIDACINVFGIDNSGTITQNIDLVFQFIQKTMDENERKIQRERFHAPINEIFQSAALFLEEKFTILSKLYIDNLNYRGMNILTVGFSSENGLIIIEIPTTDYNDMDDKELFDRALNFSRYAILARSAFNGLFPKILVREKNDTNEVGLYVLYEGDDLQEWIDEKASLLDILNDSKHFLKKNPILFNVDFKKKKEIDDLALGEIFPSKKRMGS